MAKPKKSKPTACPIYTIETKPFDLASWQKGVRIRGAEVIALADGKLAGRASARIVGKTLHVEFIRVVAEHQRCGVGTKIYAALAAWGCRRKKPLQSDSNRTAMSQGFWEKQEAKGRASCTAPATNRGTYDELEPAVGRGGCYQYRLRCPVTDLSGRRKR